MLEKAKNSYNKFRLDTTETKRVKNKPNEQKHALYNTKMI